MSAFDNLAPDQRAVLQMVLQRGRSYDEIAALLKIDRGAVRQRALDAFDALTPASVLPGPERALVTDYLLRQLPERVSEQVYTFLEASEIDREWAQALTRVIAPLTPASLPEITVGAPLGADPGPAGGLEHDSDPQEPSSQRPDKPSSPPAPVEAIADAAAQWPQDAWSEQSRPRRPVPPAPPAREPRSREPRPSSRRGGAILLGAVGVVIVAVILVVVLTSGGGKQPAHKTASTGSGNTATQTVSTPASTETGTTSTTSTTTAVLAQLNLSSPSGAKSPVGIVQVVRVDGGVGMILVAQGVPANTTHNAYAVWLYNSPTSYKFVGFVQYLVGKSGKIDTEGRLKAGAAGYHHLLVTLETKSNPTAPGEIVLEGPFREHS